VALERGAEQVQLLYSVAQEDLDGGVQHFVLLTSAYITSMFIIHLIQVYLSIAWIDVVFVVMVSVWYAVSVRHYLASLLF